MQRLSTLFKTALTCGATSATLDADPLREQRRRVLYPPRFRGSSLDERLNRPQALQPGPAEQLQREVLNGRPLLHAWNDAISDGRPDILRALLLLTDERDIRYMLARPQYNSPLQQALPVADAGLAEVIKQYPYQSGKAGPDGQPFPPRNFNGCVPFAGVEPAQNIECRHFAIHLLRSMQGHPALKFDYQAEYADAESIRRTITPTVESHYRDWRTGAQEAHLIRTADFGAFLTSQFAAMRNANRTSKCLLMESSNHALGLALRIKQKNGQRWCVVKLYDPNQTTHITRSKARDHTTFATHNLEAHLFDGGAMRAYFPEPNSCVAFFAGNHGAAPAAPASTQVLTSCIPTEQVDATVMYFLLSKGFDGNITGLKPMLAALPAGQLSVILTARNTVGTPGLSAAMQHQQTSAIRAFGKLIGLLPAAMRADHLAAIRADGTPALHLAMQEDYGDVVRAFGACLRSVPQDQRADLLAAKTPEGRPALLAAALCGRARAVRAFADLLALIPVGQRLALLSMPDAEGNTSLLGATLLRRPEIVAAYAALLEKLPPEQRVTLLAMPDPSGCTGFKAAMLDGDAATIAAWKILIRLLPADDARSLLTRLAATGASGSGRS